jgi:hypothetical protein
MNARLHACARRAVKFAALAVAIATAAAALPVDPVELITDARVDSVTVGERFRVAYRFSFPDTLAPVVPDRLADGTCRVVATSWSERRADGRVERTAEVIFIPVDLDSAVVPAYTFAFLAPGGDTLFATSDAIEVPVRRIAADAKDTRPLKEQWTPAPNYLLWAALAAGALALAGAIVWWVRRRRARRGVEAAPEIRLPPEVVALTELERIAAMGLLDRGEFKTYYTLVVDVVRRYLEARFGIEAMDRTSSELIALFRARDVASGDLTVLLEEADLVKFAKLTPSRDDALAAIERARTFVVDTTPRPEPVAAVAASEA